MIFFWEKMNFSNFLELLVDILGDVDEGDIQLKAATVIKSLKIQDKMISFFTHKNGK